MKLRTLIPVTYNEAGAIANQETSIIEMTIQSVAYYNNFTSIGVNYTYAKEDGTVIRKDAFNINGAPTINGIFAAIQPNLPPFQNEVENTQWKFILGAQLEMANTFKIAPSQIQIIQ